MKTSHTIIIDAPASLVFQILMDADLATKWVPIFTSHRLISGPPNQVGSKYETQIDVEGMKYRQVSEIRAYDENQYIRWATTCYFHDMEFVISKGEVEYYITSISDVSTEFKHSTEIHYKGLMKFLMWFGKSKNKKAADILADEMHRNFKSFVEMTYYG